MEESRKDSSHSYLGKEGVFLLTSFSLHLLIISILFHLPLYPHSASFLPRIEVKLIAEDKGDKKVTETSNPPAPPVILKEKTKKPKKIKNVKTNMAPEKIVPAHNLIPPSEKVILDNVDLGSAGRDLLPREDDFGLNEQMIFPEKKAEAKNEESPQLADASPLIKALDSLPGDGNLSEKAGSSLALPEGGSGRGPISTTSAGSVWLEAGSGGKGNSARPATNGKSATSPSTGQSPNSGYSKISGKAGNGKDALAAFLGLARKKIEEAKRYPWEALRRNWQGKVVLSFWVDQKGQVRDIQVVQSSGYKVLDEEAQATLRRASPLPSPPQGGEEGFKIVVPILFRLE